MCVCNCMFQNIVFKQQPRKVPPRHYFDGPVLLTVERDSDICCKIESQSWEADKPMKVKSI